MRSEKRFDRDPNLGEGVRGSGVGGPGLDKACRCGEVGSVDLVSLPWKDQLANIFTDLLNRFSRKDGDSAVAWHSGAHEEVCNIECFENVLVVCTVYCNRLGGVP